MFTNNIIDSFGNVLVSTNKSKAIDLMEEKNFDTAERGGVNCTVMSCAFKVEVRGRRG